ncbi:hypothetical protein ACRAWD_22105 [Caulobacter segnis]
MAKLTQAVTADEALRTKLTELGFTGSAGEVAAAALIDFALSNNTGGVVLASMFRPEHLAFNIDRASRSPNPELVSLLQGYDLDRTLTMSQLAVVTARAQRSQTHWPMP